MVNHLIIIRLNNVHKDEQKTLKTYLENNCWDWNETNNEDLINYNSKKVNHYLKDHYKRKGIND
jgi:hypothetical protein